MSPFTQDLSADPLTRESAKRARDSARDNLLLDGLEILVAGPSAHACRKCLKSALRELKTPPQLRQVFLRAVSMQDGEGEGVSEDEFFVGNPDEPFELLTVAAPSCCAEIPAGDAAPTFPTPPAFVVAAAVFTVFAVFAVFVAAVAAVAATAAAAAYIGQTVVNRKVRPLGG